MFNYDLSSFFVTGFKKIVHLDATRCLFLYKHHNLIIEGNNLKVCDLCDKGLTIKGDIEVVKIVRDKHD